MADEFIELIESCLRKMDKKFTDLSKLRMETPTLKEIDVNQKLQERPFAYEFYHQFRTLWESDDAPDFLKDLVIQGEVNKTYQNIPKLKKMPDFLIHKPNTNERNFAVIEFKMASRRYGEIEDDFKKLKAFKNILGYRYLVEVILGLEEELTQIENKIKEKLEIKDSSVCEPIPDWIFVIEFNTNKEMRASKHYCVNPERLDI